MHKHPPCDRHERHAHGRAVAQRADRHHDCGAAAQGGERVEAARHLGKHTQLNLQQQVRSQQVRSQVIQVTGCSHVFSPRCCTASAIQCSHSSCQHANLDSLNLSIMEELQEGSQNECLCRAPAAHEAGVLSCAVTCCNTGPVFACFLPYVSPQHTCYHDHTIAYGDNPWMPCFLGWHATTRRTHTPQTPQACSTYRTAAHPGPTSIVTG